MGFSKKVSIQNRKKTKKLNVPFLLPKKQLFTFIDLFAGVGGFRLALQNKGGVCVYSSEFNEASVQTYKVNFGDIPFGDITKEITKKKIPQKFDILCAGFPCQAFSIAGKRKGFEDKRGTLFFDVDEIIKKHKPKVVLLENVKNLVFHNNGATFKTIINSLKNGNEYKVYYAILNSMTHANIPQNRERVFIVALDKSKVKNYHRFKFPKKIQLQKKVRSLLKKERQADKYYYSKKHKHYFTIKREIISNSIYQWRRSYVRENKSGVCPTLTANMGTGGHNVPIILDDFGIRKLTPKECFLLQGYPNNFILPMLSDSKLYMQSGNSVTVPLVERIMKEILAVM